MDPARAVILEDSFIASLRQSTPTIQAQKNNNLGIVSSVNCDRTNAACDGARKRDDSCGETPGDHLRRSNMAKNEIQDSHSRSVAPDQHGTDDNDSESSNIDYNTSDSVCQCRMVRNIDASELRYRVYIYCLRC